jgi:hypothetical protein
MFTAVIDHIQLAPEHYKFTGYTYLWMFFIWGSAFYISELESKAMERNGWIFPVRNDSMNFFPSPKTLANPFWQLRWLVYMLTAWTIEYSTGYTIRAITGHCPWVRTFLSTFITSFGSVEGDTNINLTHHTGLFPGRV